jgi:hypothetical protein
MIKKYYRKPEKSEKISITYAGSFYHGRSPQLLLDAAAELEDSIASDFHFHFIGEISPGQVQAIESMQLKAEITIHGKQNHEYCLSKLAESDICLLMAIGQPNQIPAKVYEYIGLGRPILSISEPGDSCMRMLESKDWAWAVVADDKAGLANSLKDIHQRWQNDNLPVIDPDGEGSEYAFDKIASQYADFIRQTIKSK